MSSRNLEIKSSDWQTGLETTEDFNSKEVKFWAEWIFKKPFAIAILKLWWGFGLSLGYIRDPRTALKDIPSWSVNSLAKFGYVWVWVAIRDCEDVMNRKIWRGLNLRLKLDWNCLKPVDSGTKESKLNEVRWVMSSMTHYHESLSWFTRWKAMLRNICYVIGIVHECPSRGYYFERWYSHGMIISLELEAE